MELAKYDNIKVLIGYVAACNKLWNWLNMITLRY